MPKTSKTPSTRTKKTVKPTSRKTPVADKSISAKLSRWIANNRLLATIKVRVEDFLSRRPHRSFQRTYRRDYVRSLDIPGYIAFTHYVHKTIWNNKKIFICLALSYAAFSVILVNVASEDVYTQLRGTLTDAGGESFSGFWGQVGKAGVLVLAGASGGLNEAAANSSAQVFAVIIFLLTWLTTVWLLRVILAGRKPKMRDGLYNAGAPIIPTLLVASVIVLQLIPIAVAAFGYGAAVGSGLLEGGVEAMMFWLAAALLVMLSLYWITTTMIALVVITLPGMYPVKALSIAGDLVVGRRLRIMFRFLWMGLIVVLTWAIVMIPIILFDSWLKSVWLSISWLPLVPWALLLMSSATIVWVASYVYLLYRRIVEDDALPA